MGVKELFNEAELLNQVAEGNERAFRILFNTYRNKVFNYAFKLLRSQAAAEEVTQDVFVQIWIKRSGLTDVNNLGGIFIRVVARNYALNALKKVAREIVAISDKNHCWQDSDLSTENSISYKDTRRVLEQAIQTLPPQQKLVYQLCKIEGQKQDEVANQLGISLPTVKSHLRMAGQTVKLYMSTHSNVISFLFLMSVDQIVKK